jgi:AraC family transcriptional regulator
MQPEITEQRPLILLGFSFFGDPFKASGGWTEENEIGRLWKRFKAYLAQHRHHIKHVVTDRVLYEVQIYHEETLHSGEFEVFVGLEVQTLEDVPIEMSAKILPPTRYAIFTLHGAQIESDWPLLIYTDWLPAAGYEGDSAYNMQRYDERFLGLERLEESVMEVHIPLRR